MGSLRRGSPERETENACLDRLFRTFAASIEQLPQGYVFSGATRDAVAQCVKGFSASSVDDRLMRLVKEEYKLYKMVERKVNQDKVERLFASIDDFLQTALRILNARKSRAGRSLENHVESLLKNANVPFEVRQVLDGTRPDIIIPSKAAYEDASVPEEKLFVVGIKTTCKDRWRQVTKEAPRVRKKHILTLQEGISSAQLDEMHKSNVTLIVPKPLHKDYPRERTITIYDVDSFISVAKGAYPR